MNKYEKVKPVVSIARYLVVWFSRVHNKVQQITYWIVDEKFWFWMMWLHKV